MRWLDWVVLVGTLGFTVLYGLYRSRGSDTVDNYLLAGKTMPWYAMGLSIMATQASAITVISTTGQAYIDGMRFVQFYLGLPIAIVIVCATVVPVFHRAKVFTAYEYLEQRFDGKTRTLASLIFLMQRGLSAGIVIYAPAIVLSVILGWPERATTLITGVTVVGYTVAGGIKAVTWSDVQQMYVIFLGLIMALVTVFLLLPPSVSVADAVFLAGSAGRLNAITTNFSWDDNFNIWSGLLGATFLFLSYFGCDQSQVQRYLTGRSIAESRLSLLFNAAAKIPMQFFILFIGAMVYVFYLFIPAPLLFHGAELARIEARAEYAPIRADYDRGLENRRQAAAALTLARRSQNISTRDRSLADYRAAQQEIDGARARASRLVESAGGEKGFNDTNYIFLSFVMRYMPAGIVGLMIAVIMVAAISSASGEINSLATVSVVDFYRRYWRKEGTDRHFLNASRWATLFWGAYCIGFAAFGGRLGPLIVAVNKIGSLFYGSLLGCFVVAFAFRRVHGNAVFTAMLVAEAVVFATAAWTQVSWLWYNVIGCAVVLITSLAATYVIPRRVTF